MILQACKFSRKVIIVYKYTDLPVFEMNSDFFFSTIDVMRSPNCLPFFSLTPVQPSVVIVLFVRSIYDVIKNHSFMLVLSQKLIVRIKNE